MNEIEYKVGEKYQLMFPEVGDCFFYNGDFVYVVEVWGDSAQLSNGSIFYIGEWVRRIQQKEI